MLRDTKGSRQAIKAAPSYTADAMPTREQERQLHDHCARPHYWNDADARETDISRV